MTTRLAVMGGAYGNVPALEACIADARALRCETLAFLGDAIGFCGHSTETLAIIRAAFDICVAGNHEQQAVAGAMECGCGYASPEDEKWGCLAFDCALQDLTAEDRRWMGAWPHSASFSTPHGAILLCHGSPDRTNEFLYESQLDNARLWKWLDQHHAVGLVCTHTGLSWARRLSGIRFAMNCGAVGKPERSGDPTVRYGVISWGEAPGFDMEIRHVTYDHMAWADRLDVKGIDSVFVEPLRTGRWTCGLASLPAIERRRQG